MRTATGEAVTFTFAPVPKYSVNFAFSGFTEYASLGSLSMAGVGMEFAAYGVVGITPFPDTHGGSWQGVALQAYLRPWGGGIWGSNTVTSSLVSVSSSTSAGFYSLSGGVGVGYSYLKIDDIDLDYSQRGIGFTATWRFADQAMWFFGDIPGNTSSFAHGPWIALLFPTYAAHRASLSYKFINADIVFLDGITQFEFGGGGAF
ncbi:MAG: hypothetical protein ACREJ3_10340 [Polyangiaceae bacterium]